MKKKCRPDVFKTALFICINKVLFVFDALQECFSFFAYFEVVSDFFQEFGSSLRILRDAASVQVALGNSQLGTYVTLLGHFLEFLIKYGTEFIECFWMSILVGLQ